jgi:hypothetical protein
MTICQLIGHPARTGAFGNAIGNSIVGQLQTREERSQLNDKQRGYYDRAIDSGLTHTDAMVVVREAADFIDELIGDPVRRDALLMSHLSDQSGTVGQPHVVMGPVQEVTSDTGTLDLDRLRELANLSGGFVLEKSQAMDSFIGGLAEANQGFVSDEVILSSLDRLSTIASGAEATVTGVGVVAALNVLDPARNLMQDRMIQLARTSSIADATALFKPSSSSGELLNRLLPYSKVAGTLGLGADLSLVIADVVRAPDGDKLSTAAAGTTNIAAQGAAIVGGFKMGATAGHLITNFPPLVPYKPFAIAVGGLAGSLGALTFYQIEKLDEALKNQTKDFIDRARE